MKNKKTIASLLIIVFLVSGLAFPTFKPIIYIQANADEIVGGVGPNAWHNNSTLSVQIIHYNPRVNWYDFQYYDNNTGTWISKMNDMINVDNESKYRFIINISSDQGWEDIQYINISAWYDHGDETTGYNDTNGGNLNLQILHHNLSNGTDVSTYMAWPRNRSEVTFLGYTERTVVDKSVFENLTESRNMTFSFKPNCQFRYAPGNATWNATDTKIGNSSYYGLYNNYSWNFNITITDAGYDMMGNITRNPSESFIANEFGVEAYTEIITTANPELWGAPGLDTYPSENITIITKTNANNFLRVNISDLEHEDNSSIVIENNNVSVTGGNISSYHNLSGYAYIWGSDTPTYRSAPSEGIRNETIIRYKCSIALGKITGRYSNNLHYHLKIEESP